MQAKLGFRRVPQPIYTVNSTEKTSHTEESCLNQESIEYEKPKVTRQKSYLYGTPFPRGRARARRRTLENVLETVAEVVKEKR